MGRLRLTIFFALFTATFTGIAYLVAGLGGAMIAGFLCLCPILFSVAFADRFVLKALGAAPLTVETGLIPKLCRVLASDMDVLAERAGIAPPAIYVLDVPQPNAFATGTNANNAAIVVTTGLLKQLTRVETAGVIAHEMAHIKKGDTALAGIVAAFTRLLGAPFDGLAALAGRRRAPVAVAGSYLLPGADWFTGFILGAKREYEADRLGAEICGDPMYLANALEKLHRGAVACGSGTLAKHREFAHLFTVNPDTGTADAFRTHPPLPHRIARLRSLVDG